MVCPGRWRVDGRQATVTRRRGAHACATTEAARLRTRPDARGPCPLVMLDAHGGEPANPSPGGRLLEGAGRRNSQCQAPWS